MPSVSPQPSCLRRPGQDALHLPAIVTVPYGIAGKLGITVPLALLGVGLILRDVVVNQHAGSTEVNAVVPARLKKISRVCSPKPGAVPGEVEDLEVGEPLVDEVPLVQPTQKPAMKIAARAGGFGGRAGGVPETTGGPVGDSAPVPQRPGSGQVVLSSENSEQNPGGSFRKGVTNRTKDE